MKTFIETHNHDLSLCTLWRALRYNTADLRKVMMGYYYGTLDSPMELREEVDFLYDIAVILNTPDSELAAA